MSLLDYVTLYTLPVLLLFLLLLAWGVGIWKASQCPQVAHLFSHLGGLEPICALKLNFSSWERLTRFPNVLLPALHRRVNKYYGWSGVNYGATHTHLHVYQYVCVYRWQFVVFQSDEPVAACYSESELCWYYKEKKNNDNYVVRWCIMMGVNMITSMFTVDANHV